MSVIFVMIDGLRPDALAAAVCPNLHSLMARGAYSLNATSVMPSITLPCHTSIFHSVPPTRHGITTNDWTPMARPLPGLVDVLYNAGMRGAFFYNWEPLRNLSIAGSLWLSFFRNHVTTDIEGDRIIAETAAKTLAADRPDFAFVYLGTVDIAGHEYGWLSDGYLRQIEAVDTLLPILFNVMGDADSIFIQSDHGGHERTHGTESPEDMTIFWLAAGPGIRANHAISAPVSLLDTAPTLARMLGVRPHHQWEGHVIEEIFEVPAST